MDQTVIGTLREGEEFAGYRVVRRLGVGGMGEVYLAQHPRLPRQDAIKVLGAVDHADSSFRERFFREADIAAGIDHPNVVAIHDRGVANQRPWIAMAYIDGTDTHRMLADNPAGLDPALVAQIALELADALDTANAHGILHRDVKPANILLSDRLHRGMPRVYLADFGIAKAAGQAQSLTATSSFLGSLSYCAPEQIEGGAGPATDQYALGATLFHLLTGREVFSGGHAGELLHQHLTADPPRASEIRGSLSPDVDAVLIRALAKAPADRFPSCTAFAEALRTALDDTATGPQWSPTTVNPVPAAREVRAMASAAPLMVHEFTFGAPPLAAVGAPDTIRRRLASQWEIHGPLSADHLRTAADTRSYTLLTDPVLTSLRDVNVVFGAQSMRSLRTVITEHLAHETHENIVAAVLDVVSECNLVGAAQLPPTVAAWDCARNVQLVRECVAVGFLPQADAGALLAEFGDAAAAYPSWDAFAWGFEFGCAVEAGVHGSGRRAVRRSVHQTRPILQQLLSDPNSPWRSIPLH